MNRLTQEEWEKVVRSIVCEADYDIYKDLDPETSELAPDDCKHFMKRLVHAGQSAIGDTNDE